MPAEHIKPLTGLRFLAAAWVVLFSYWPHLAGFAAPRMVQKGYLGVELFFVLSGFILCHVYLQRAGEGGFRYGGFLWARLARVYPLHIATLAGLGLMGVLAGAAGLPVDPSVLAWSALPANLSLTQAWGLAPVAGWNHPSWSISAEWFAYLCFPLFAAAAWRLRARPYAALVGALALLAGLYAIFPRLTGFDLTQATIAWGALRIVPCFTLGCATYLMWRSGAVNRPRVAAWGAYFSGASALAAAQFGAADMLIVAFFAPLLLCLASLTSTGSKLGTARIFVYLGEISYAVYMVCIPWSLLFVNVAARVIHAQDKLLPWPIWAILVVGVVPVAAAAHHLVERPAREAMKAWVSGLPQRTQKAVEGMAA